MSLFGKESTSPSQIKKYTSLVGSLFADMYVRRESAEGVSFVKVPIQYGPASLRNKTKEGEYRTGMQFPNMAFEMTDISLDETRRQSQYVPMRVGHSTPANKYNENTSLQPVPHNIGYRLYIRTKLVEEALQILEQIVGAFNPHIAVDLIDSTGMEIERAIHVNLESGYEYTDNYEDSFENNRFIEVSVSLTVRGYIYKKVESKPIVLSIELTNQDGALVASVSATKAQTDEYLKLGIPSEVKSDMNSVSGGSVK